MLSRFTLNPSTYKILAMLSNPGKEIIHFPSIWDLLPSPNVTLPPFFGSNVLKRKQSLVICLEHIKINKHVSITLRAICIMKHTPCLLVKSYGKVLSL